MVDQVDRDWELISYNTHPYQLFTYEVHNKQIAYETEKKRIKEEGGETYEEKMLKYFEFFI